MADHSRFGPAGVPPLFRAMGADLLAVPALLREEGLDAFEYEAVRWGKIPQIKQAEAEKLGLEAKRNDVLLSVHGSYYINLAGEKDVLEASKQRLIACASAAEWMGAYVAVFHPGFYGKIGKSSAFKKCVESLKDVVKTMESLGIRNVKLGAETMGRHVQLGSLEEILNICAEVDRTQLVIDWSHLHARGMGRFRTRLDFRSVIEEVEKKLGIEAARNMHCHFTKIEFTEKGEKRHHVLDEKKYGPNFQLLAETISEFRLRPVVICETPMLDIDAMKMKNIFLEVRKNLG
jgi:deoxyribonuclease-4